MSVPHRALMLSSGIFVLSICSFMVVPLLALYLAKELHTPAGRIGIVLSVMVVTNQGLQLFIGLLSDRFGTRAVFTLGVLAASLGYLGFAAHPSFPGQLVCAFALGLGRATISLVSKAMLVEEAGDQHASALTLRSIAVNAGAAIGPVLGGLLFGRFTIALWVAIAIHALCWTTLIRMTPRPGTEAAVDADATGAAGTASAAGTAGTATTAGAADTADTPRPAMADQLRALLGNRPLVGVTCASIGFWYLYSQLTFTFPLYADDRFALAGRVGLLFTVNAVLAVALQYSAITWFGRRSDSWRTLSIGCTVLAVSFVSLGLASAAWALVLFITVFSLGEIIVVPTLDILTSEVAAAHVLAGSFGFASLGWAAGGLLGNLAGGWSYQAAKAAGRFDLFWAGNVAVGAATALAFVVLRRRFRQETGGDP